MLWSSFDHLQYCMFIALGADQSVSNWNQRQMRELRTAIDCEVAAGLAAWGARVLQGSCV
jgi:hypothetical protein